jgi:hypothetical protein
MSFVVATPPLTILTYDVMGKYCAFTVNQQFNSSFFYVIALHKIFFCVEAPLVASEAFCVEILPEQIRE